MAKRNGTGCRLLACAVVGVLSMPAEGTVADRDGAAIAAHNDVVYETPARHGWQGLPLGNGRIGAQVWQPDGLAFHLNSDWSGVYGGALARLHLQTVPGMLAARRGCRQVLSLGTATVWTRVTSDRGDLSVSSFIPAGRDVLVLDVNDARTGAGGGTLVLEGWRTTAACRVDGGGLLLTDTLRVRGEPDYRYAVLVAVGGAAAEMRAEAERRGSLRTAGGRFRVWAAVSGTRDPDVDVAAAARAQLAAARADGLAAVTDANARWWRRFWGRSFVVLRSEDGVADYAANLWYTHLYAMGAGSRGAVPPKFNGGFWIWDGDEREWGAHYWHWNTQETYWPVFAANQLELHRPYLDLYWNMLPEVTAWTREAWETDGAQFQETIPFHGRMPVWEKARGVHPRLPVPKDVRHANLILSTSAEIAMQFWWHYLYTGDERLLRERVYPLTKEVVTFYVNYLTRDEQGRYNMVPSNAHETFWSVKNPASDLAALRYILPAAIRMSETLGVDETLRAVWRDRLDNLAPFPIDPETGAIRDYEAGLDGPAPQHNAENPNLFPVGVFPLITLGQPRYGTGRRSFHHRLRTLLHSCGWNTDIIAAARLGLADAADDPGDDRRHGVAWLLPRHVERFQNYPAGLQDYYGRKPAKHCYLEGSGTFATAVGEMLLQSWNGTIRVCPALPSDWDADFKLLAMGGFEVGARARRGRVRQVSILSLRGGTVRLVNPFDGPATVACAGREAAADEGPTLAFETAAGRTYTVAPSGAAVAPAPLPVPPAGAARALSDRGPRWRNAPASRAGNGPHCRGLTASSRRWIGIPPSALAAWDPGRWEPVPRVRPAAAEPAAAHAVRRKAGAIAVDGLLTDAGWSNVAAVGGFRIGASGEPATQPTTVRFCHDDDTLYVAAVCRESAMDRLRADCEAVPHDFRDNPFLFEDDTLELLVHPSRPGAPLLRLAVNALGLRFDAQRSAGGADDLAFNPDGPVATALGADGWVLEAAVPFNTFGPLPPAAGETWRLDVRRYEQPHAETSGWAGADEPAYDDRSGPLGVVVFPDAPAAAPGAAAADPDLVGWWPLDSVRGMWVIDASGNGHHGRMNRPMSTAPGRRGQALRFDGGFVSVPDSPALVPTGGMTVAVWVRPDRIQSARIVDKGRAGTSTAYMLDTHPHNHLRVVTSAGVFGVPDVALPAGTWRHVALVAAPDRLYLYLDGGSVAEQVVRRPLTDTTRLPLRFGADSNDRNRFSGLLDDIRIYRRVLGADEIKALASGVDADGP